MGQILKSSEFTSFYTGDGKERRKEILDIAAYLFATKGYDGVGMRMIAESVGMREASLYNHFESKQDMLYKICLSASKYYAQTRGPMLSVEGNYEQQLEDLIQSHVVVVWQDRYYVLTLQRCLDRLSSELSDEINSYRHDYQVSFQNFIARGVDAKALNVIDPWLAGISVLLILNNIFSWFKDDGTMSIDEIAARHTDLIKHFLGMRGAS